MPTLVENSGTRFPYGNGLTVESGSDNLFVNDMFADQSTFGPNPTAQYAGAAVTLTCTDNVTFQGGAIQDNGPFNPLMIMQGFSSTQCAAGANNISTHFYGVDFEIAPATIGTFAGHAANVNPFQINDSTDVIFDHMTVFGARGA